MLETIEQYEKELKDSKRKYNPRSGAIHGEPTFNERNRVSSQVVRS